MPVKQRVIGIAAGLLTPLPLAIVVKLFSVPGSPPVSWKTAVAIILAVSMAIALWREVDLLAYCITLSVSFFVWYLVIAGAQSATSGNLFGLVMIAAIAGGVIVAALVACCAGLLRRWNAPPWISAIPVIAAFLILAYDRRASAHSAEGAPRHLQDLRRAELVFATTSPGHAYTCDGPALNGLSGIQWRDTFSPDGQDRNEGEMDGFWIVLQCATPQSRPYFSARAQALWPGGPVYVIDSDSPEPRRKK